MSTDEKKKKSLNYTDLEAVAALEVDESEPPARTSVDSGVTQRGKDNDNYGDPYTPAAGQNRVDMDDDEEEEGAERKSTVDDKSSQKQNSKKSSAAPPPSERKGSQKCGRNSQAITLCGYPEPTCKVNVPPQVRLPIHMKTGVDKMRSRLKQPPDAVPKTYLPSWKELPLSTKLPRVPAPPGTLYFSRGPVAKPLLRTNPNFSLNDPFGLQRVPTHEYNALHDIHAFNYFEKPVVRKLLAQQNLVSCDNQVVCTHKEFNQFRNYLAAIQNDELNGVMSSEDQKWLSDREQVLRLLKYQSMESTSGRDYDRWVKTRNAQRKNKIKHDTMIRRMEERRDAEDARLRRIEADKQRQLLDRKIQGEEKDRLIAERRRQKLERDLQSRERLITQISMKDAAVQRRVEDEKAFLQRAYNQFLMEWLHAKCEFQEKNNPKVEAIERDLESNNKRGALQRQAQVERYRARLPEIVEKRKARQLYIYRLVRKYFYRWLFRVRERKSRKPDALHQSLWDAVAVLDETLKYLRKESGYEKLDAFILNIMKLKGDIKQRLSEEEEAERRNANESKRSTEDDSMSGVSNKPIVTTSDE